MRGHMNTRHPYIDFHLLQTVPYANLNRDDLGSPKAVVYGGANRTRVSSQCWKRATRMLVEDQVDDRAVRTRRLPEQVAKRLLADGWPEELADFAARSVVASAADGIGMANDSLRTNVLLYLPHSAIDALADLAVEHRAALEEGLSSKSEGKGPRKGQQLLPKNRVQQLVAGRAGTISLFGRMIAEMPAGGVDGCVQVAHAFTVHATEPEIDFFTAVDDINTREETGSGHMNSAEFSAGVFYRFASVDLAGLIDNLDGDEAMARELANLFLQAFVAAVPSGKQTSTAAQTLPDLVYVAVRGDRPLSLAGAYEAPVRAASEGGHAEPARRRLADYAARLNTLWGADGIVDHAHAGIDDKEHAGLGTRVGSYTGLVDRSLDRAFGVGEAAS